MVEALGPGRSEDLAELLADGRSREYVAAEFPSPETAQTVVDLYDWMVRDAVLPGEAAAYLQGFAAAWRRGQGDVQVNVVWSGPTSATVPVRSTAQVLTEVVREARSELLAMTYSARPYRPLRTALAEAVARGVDVNVVVETNEGAGHLLSGPEPSAAFADVAGLRLWHWPVDSRARRPTLQHAKLAVADRRVLLVGSANLTESGARRNLEAGTVVRGGPAPERAAEHIRALMREGVLQPLSRG
ncbi:DISARM system phospholipase D-like protein DrmC [Kitasatospora sp. NPDC007106]|uniref:DISARM system phospholipase D-like protein DrmC n=1 Tax=Kitasatospora sp. NPDC007106 TaxID=3156914 RepID=UPI0033E7D545